MGRSRLMEQQRARMEARRAAKKKEKLGPPTPSSSRIGKLTDPMALRKAAAEYRKKKKKEEEEKKKKYGQFTKTETL